MAAPLRFSSHAVLRMRLRRIRPSEVAEALENVTRERIGAIGDVVIRFGTTAAGRRLKVVQPREDDGYVITVVAPGEGG